MLSRLNQLQSRSGCLSLAARPRVLRSHVRAGSGSGSRSRVPIRGTLAPRRPPYPPPAGLRRAPSTHQVKSLPFILHSRPTTLLAAPCACGGGAPGPVGEAASMREPAVCGARNPPKYWGPEDGRRCL